MTLERWICSLNLWIKNGHLLDPAAGCDQICDLYVMDGTVAAVGSLPEDKKEIFSFLTIFQVLQGAFLIFHVF